jgi:hypothetical protein
VSNDFDAAMLTRLRASDTEAARVVLDLVKGGRAMPDAIADAVETMSWPETAELRRWTENWEAWSAWQRFESMGWKIDKMTRRRVLVDVPAGKRRELARMWLRFESQAGRSAIVRAGHIPSETAVAAAADVGEVTDPLIVEDATHIYPYAIRYLAYDIKRQK